MSREDRVEEIRGQVEQGMARGYYGVVVDSDYRFLLSEIDRLRKVEEAARELLDAQFTVGRQQSHPGSGGSGPAGQRVLNAWSSLSNTLEQSP